MVSLLYDRRGPGNYIPLQPFFKNMAWGESVNKAAAGS